MLAVFYEISQFVFHVGNFLATPFYSHLPLNGLQFAVR